jgi:phytoene dehydrogenase-like protein
MAFHGRAARAVVVGGGVGGLACAIDLAGRGVAVTLCERAATVGGKLRQLAVADRCIDAGPTVLTMRWVFEGLFADAGTALDEQVRLRPLDDAGPARVGGRLAARPARGRRALGGGDRRVRGGEGGARASAFSRHAAAIYEQVSGPFIAAARPTVTSVLGSLGLRGLARHLQDRLSSQHVEGARRLFSRPAAAPAVRALRDLLRQRPVHGACDLEPDRARRAAGGVDGRGRDDRAGDGDAAGGQRARGVCSAAGRRSPTIAAHAGKVRGVVLADGRRSRPTR